MPPLTDSRQRLSPTSRFAVTASYISSPVKIRCLSFCALAGLSSECSRRHTGCPLPLFYPLLWNLWFFSCFYVVSPWIGPTLAISQKCSDPRGCLNLMLIGLHLHCHTTSACESCLARFVCSAFRMFTVYLGQCFTRSALRTFYQTQEAQDLTIGAVKEGSVSTRSVTHRA